MSKKVKKKCSKCGKYHFCDEHHILPYGIFGEGETDSLCKNCHDEYHRFLGHKFLRKSNKQLEEFYIEKYLRWVVGLSLLIGIIIFSIQ